MAYPEGVTTCDVLIGDAVDFHGNSVDVTVFITPVLGGEATHLVHAESGVPLAPIQSAWTTKGGSGLVSIPLPHVDQAGFIDESGASATYWAYRADVVLESKGRRVTYQKNFQLVIGQTLVDLDKIPDGPIAEPVSAPTATVTSVDSRVGAVDLSDSYAPIGIAPEGGAQAVGKGELLINALDLGVVISDAVDQSAALNTADAHAASLGARLYVPPGTYRIDSTVTFTSSVDAAQATFHYYGADLALRAGRTDTAVFERAYHLPTIYYKAGATWAAGTVGVELVNLNTCQVFHEGRIQGFSTGYRFIGRGTGFAYNTILLGYSDMNRVDYHLTQDEGGWCNENTFIGGRIQKGDAWGAVADDPDAHYLLIERASTSVGGPNNNRFFGVCFEGPNFAYYRVKTIGARYNTFYGCRWENYGSTYRVLWSESSAFNVIHYGYDSWQIKSEQDATSDRNIVIDGIGAQMNARAGGTLSVPHNTPTVISTWGVRTTYQSTYDTGTGEWSPAPGTWDVRAKVTFYGAASGTYQVKLRTAAGTVLDIAQINANGGMISVPVGAVHIFKPGDAVVVEVTQTSGGDLSINPYTGWTTFDAIRVNG